MAADFARMHWILQRSRQLRTFQVDHCSYQLKQWGRGFKLHRCPNSVHDEFCIYIYVYLPVIFLPLSPIHPLFFLHIWFPCDISPSSFCLWPLANLTSCSSWWTIWAGPTWASTGILPFPSPLWRPIWIAWPVTRLLLVNFMGEALRYMMIYVSFFVNMRIHIYGIVWVVNMYGWFLEAQVPNYLSQSSKIELSMYIYTRSNHLNMYR